MVSLCKESADDKDEKHCLAQQEVRTALYELLESTIKLVDKKAADKHGQHDERDGDDVKLFSDQLKEQYNKTVLQSSRLLQNSKSSTGRKKRKRDTQTQSSESSDDEESRMKLLASIAVSADDLNTSNCQKKAKHDG